MGTVNSRRVVYQFDSVGLDAFRIRNGVYNHRPTGNARKRHGEMTTATAWQSDYGEHEAAMVAYRETGTARAQSLDNRGPIRYDADGALHKDIVESYWRHGFYVFEGVIGGGRPLRGSE